MESEPDGGGGGDEEDEGGEAAGGEGAAYDLCGDAGPESRGFGFDAALAEPGDAGGVHAVAEGGEEGGQERDRAEHGEADDEDGAEGEAFEDVDAGEEQAGHADDDGEAGGGHDVAGGAGGGAQGRGPVFACGAFFSEAAQVEQGVVDADGHADEQDDGGGGAVEGDPVAEKPEEAEGAGDAVAARRSGSPAATREPNTARRTRMVSGSEVVSARRMSSLMPASTAPERVASPACRTSIPGWSLWTRSRASSTAS